MVSRDREDAVHAHLPAPSVAVIGAGGSGLAMARALKSAGLPFTVYEKADDVGGTWRDNTYPGLVVDAPGSVMAFSFERDTGFDRVYPTGAELQRYVSRVADAHGLREHVEFRTEIVEACWTAGRWVLRTGDGRRFEYDLVVHATGFLQQPNVPDIPGLADFAGDTFHSSRWDHASPIRHGRVGVIGTGSSGVQIVGALAGVADRVVHFARTPQWILPTFNPVIPSALRWVLARSVSLERMWTDAITRVFLDLLVNPAMMREGPQRRLIGWASRRNLRRVRDPALRGRLTPNYQPLCKRPVFSASYYDAVQGADVELVDGAIDRIVAEGVRTIDGRLHELDVLVLATGFHSHAYMRPMRVVGRDGVPLDEVWKNGPRAYNAIAVAGFPNMFMLVGPHSPLLGSPIWDSAERQARYIIALIGAMRQRNAASCAATAEAGERWYAGIRAGMNPTVWGGGCESWYMAPDGVAVQWPFTRKRWCRLFDRPDLADFEFAGPAGQPIAGTGERAEVADVPL
jgi:cation diffusion facilitator CzcD-associated flavoprotein CzcO